MDAKWPLPDYMQGIKGVNSYKEETYSLVTCWTEDTKIQYRPHAKSPGSKSHLRYEIYSNAKTVGEALAFGSYPQDWCWDYERGFIQVVESTMRDEPLMPEEEQEGVFTDVDHVVMKWAKLEVARSL